MHTWSYMATVCKRKEFDTYSIPLVCMNVTNVWVCWYVLHKLDYILYSTISWQNTHITCTHITWMHTSHAHTSHECTHHMHTHHMNAHITCTHTHITFTHTHITHTCTHIHTHTPEHWSAVTQCSPSCKRPSGQKHPITQSAVHISGGLCRFWHVSGQAVPQVL